MDVTVAICTWNRADLLDQTLARMRELRIPEGVEWELIVVNNNCTDRTDVVIANYADTLPIRRIHESKQGQSNARNGAIAAACGDLLLWTDDDVLVDTGWMEAYVRAARQWPDHDFFAGRVDPWFEVERPDWLVEAWPSLTKVYSVINLGDHVMPFPDDHYPAGANMAIRLPTQRRHPFNTNLGLSKRDNIRGDDNCLYFDLCKSGVRSLWVGDARVEHFIPKSRITRQYVGQWYEGAARTVIRVGGSPFEVGRTFFGVPHWLLRSYLECLAAHSVSLIFRRTSAIDEFIRLKKLEGTIGELFRTRHLRPGLARLRIPAGTDS